MSLLRRTEKKFELVLDHVVEACLEYASNYDHSRLLQGVPPKDQLELLKNFTHLKNEEFYENRRGLYQQIFKDVFTRNGKVIPPVSSGKKQRFIIAGTYFNGKTDFLRGLFERDKSIPTDVQRKFDSVNNKHAVVINAEKIREYLPEYTEAIKSGYPYPSLMVRGEVNAITELLLSTAKQCGYNIIDFSKSHTAPVSDEDIDLMRGLQRKESQEIRSMVTNEYELHTVAVTASPEVVLSQVEKGVTSIDDTVSINKAQRSMRELALPNSFQKLMRNSKSSFVVWDNGRRSSGNRFDVVASAKNGELNIKSRALWEQFKQQKDTYLSGERSSSIAFG